MWWACPMDVMALSQQAYPATVPALAQWVYSQAAMVQLPAAL